MQEKLPEVLLFAAVVVLSWLLGGKSVTIVVSDPKKAASRYFKDKAERMLKEQG